MLSAGQREAFLGLLDDPGINVRQALLAHFQALGEPAQRFLQEVARGPHRILARHAAWYLDELRFSDPVAEFRGFIRSLNYELETGAFLLSRTVQPRLDIGACCAALDGMEIDGLVGTLAGDDTAFLAMRDVESAEAFENEIEKLL